MSYSERLSAFNDAVAHTSDHIDAIKKTLTNPELKENPVKMGLNVAGSVLGTGEGLLAVKRGMEDKGFLRRGFKAMAQRLGRKPEGTTSGTGGGGEGSASNGGESGARAGASDGAARADGAPTDRGTGGRSAGDSGAAQPAEGEGGGAARPAAAEGGAEGGGAAPTETPAVEAPARTVAGTEAAGGEGQAVARTAPEDNPFSFQNFQPRAGDTTSITRGASARDVSDPFSPPRTLQQSRTSYGSNPTRNAVANEGEGVPDSALPNSGGGAAGSDIVDTARAGAGDISDAARATASGVEEGQRTLQSAQNLQGRVQSALGNSGTADSASGQANMVSQAQHGNAAQHAAQQNPNSESGADGGAQSDAASAQARNGGQAAQGAEGEGGGLNPAGGGSSGAAAADEGAGSGIRAAEGVETTLDETLGEVPIIGPLLEGVSLLATLGTTIAGAFQPDQVKGKSAADKGAALPSELAVGANLKQNSGGAVGAY